MAGQGIDRMGRQLGRARKTAERALAAPAGELTALRLVADEMVADAAAFASADKAFKLAQRAATKEIDEAAEAMGPLAKAYEQARDVVTAKTGDTSFGAPTTYPTPDDFLRAAEDLEDVLEEKKAEPWAAELLTLLSPLLDAAIKEALEAGAARKALQKAQTARAQAAGHARPVFVGFRRVVRSTFGASSREHTELRDRRGAGGDDSGDDTEPTDGGGEPKTDG